MKKPKICVVGSINMDFLTITTSIPTMGETVKGHDFQMSPGGKGANQAVSASKLGADVSMIGLVGDDIFGEELLQNFLSQGVNIDGVSKIKDVSTGIANITVTKDNNKIIIIPGANQYVTESYLEKVENIIEQSDVILLQLEIPLETVMHVIDLANKLNKIIILDPAPYEELPKDIISKISFITPNEIEAKKVISSFDEDAVNGKLIVTKGSLGIDYYREDGLIEHIKAFPIDVQDTTGAGDAFSGALAKKLGEGIETIKAIQFANAAAALSTLNIGAQGSMPSEEEIKKFMKI